MDDTLLSIDDHLLKLRRAPTRPGYRRQLLEGLGDVTLPSLQAIRAVERAEAAGISASIRAVAADLQIEHSTASRTVAEATRLGLLSRSAAAHDQRQAVLTVTEEGRKVSARAAANRHALVEEALNGWDPDDISILNRLLGDLVTAMTRASE